MNADINFSMIRAPRIRQNVGITFVRMLLALLAFVLMTGATLLQPSVGSMIETALHRGAPNTFHHLHLSHENHSEYSINPEASNRVPSKNSDERNNGAHEHQIDCCSIIPVTLRSAEFPLLQLPLETTSAFVLLGVDGKFSNFEVPRVPSERAPPLSAVHLMISSLSEVPTGPPSSPLS